VNEELRRFSAQQNLDLLIAEDVDPLHDMDRWCALVANCSLVVSAANTTIHGAGCLGIPTWVILGRDPDWRWLGDPGNALAPGTNRCIPCSASSRPGSRRW
jgi:ADP-heptose:LPS heptosyltransferase